MEEPQPQPPVDPGAGEPAQPAPAADPAAATPPEPSTTAPAEPSQDDNLAWLRTKGIDPTDPEAVSKIADMYRNAEKTMHESTAKASVLEKSLKAPDATQPSPTDDVAGLTTKVAALERTIEVNNFMADPAHKALEPKMAELVTNDPTLRALVNQGYMSVEQLYYMAKGSDAGQEAQLKAEGGKEALEQVASKQAARAIPGNATSSSLGEGAVTKANFDSWYAGLSSSERADPKNQAIAASLM